MNVPRFRTQEGMDSLIFQGTSLVNRWALEQDQEKCLSKQEAKTSITEWVRFNIPEKATPKNSFVTRRVRTDEKPLKQIRLISDYFEKVDKKVNSEGEHTKQTRIVDFFSKTTNEEGIEDNLKSTKISKNTDDRNVSVEIVERIEPKTTRREWRAEWK